MRHDTPSVSEAADRVECGAVCGVAEKRKGPGTMRAISWYVSHLIARPGRGAVPPVQEHRQEGAALQRRVAEALFRRGVVTGGGVADIGLLGPPAYLDHADEVLKAVALGNAQPGPPAP